MTKYADGPWEYHDECDPPAIALAGDDGLIMAEMTIYASNDRDLPDDIQNANGRLMAAAPDLLAALKRLMDERCPFECDTESCECGENGTGFDDDGNPCEHIQARRAIAKTER